MATNGHIADLLNQVFTRTNIKRGVKRAQAVLLWPRLVGAELSAFSTATALRDGVLYVSVSDSETAMHLTLERHRFVTGYRERFGIKDVREIRFQVGRLGSDLGAEASADPLPAPDPEEVAQLSDGLSQLELPTDVALQAERVAVSLAQLRAERRRRGWQPCAACGTLHDGNLQPESLSEATHRLAARKNRDHELKRRLCATCYRYARERRVIAASDELRASPQAPCSSLSHDERAVASILAMSSLEEVIDALLPVALKNPASARQLASAARCRLALSEGRSPNSFTPEELAAFDRRLGPILATFTNDRPGA